MSRRFQKHLTFMRNLFSKGVKPCATLAVVALSFTSLGANNAAAQSVQKAQEKSVTKLTQTAATLTPTLAARENWRKTILRIQRPKKACFVATYPETQWREMACKKAPNRPYPPKHGIRPELGGGGAGADFSAQKTPHVSTGEGSFDSVSGVTSESSQSGADSYSLQLNTQFFTTTTCNTSPAPSTCQGWEQFVYSSSGSGFIQYWLITYGPGGTKCPSGWMPFSFTTGGEVYCYVNAAQAAGPPAEKISSLSQLKLTGSVAGVSGADDSITVAVGNSLYSAPGDNHFPDLGTQWQKAEFNVFGDGGGDQANFNIGSTIVVRTGVDSGTAGAPTCDGEGFTGETNNLTLVSTPTGEASSPLASIIFTESNAAASTPASCATATSNGDTHLTTFDGLYYDFQASGDFVLAQDGVDFLVQTRQASGAPAWPNTSVNKAVAVKMGTSRVALYIEPTKLVIDGAANNLADGKTVQLPTGVQISRRNNLYVISSESGDSVRATLNGTWINVTVGLGHALTTTRGLLGNPRGNAQVLATASGAVLRSPISFTDLYHSYADSWRVSPAQSLFTEKTTIKDSIPAKPFFATDLDPTVSAHALAACKAAGVSAHDLLEACTLDNTVLKDEVALKVFVHAAPPRFVIKPVLQVTPVVRQVVQ
jgi:von Willebrand factor type D domain